MIVWDSGRIISLTAPRMTTTQTSANFAASLPGSVFVQSVNCVLAAGRIKPTLSPKKRTECDPIKTDDLYQKPGHLDVDYTVIGSEKGWNNSPLKRWHKELHEYFRQDRNRFFILQKILE